MNSEMLFTAALGLSGGWKVVGFKFSGEPQELNLWIDFEVGTRFAAPGSDVLCPVHDTENKSWRHLNFFQFATHLHARVPRVRKPDGKVVLVEVPWARPGSGFTLQLEALVMALAEHMPVSEIAEVFGVHDTKLWRAIKHYVERSHQAADWSKVRRVHVDETSIRRGHTYVTNFMDADTRQLLLMVEGNRADTFEAFAEALRQHGGAVDQIEAICMDMSPSFKSGAAKTFPNATVIFDAFHIMQAAGRALDATRKDLQRAGAAELKGGLWAIRGNQWTRTEEQLELRKALCKQYPKLGRAVNLRDMLQDVLAGDHLESLDWWCKRAKRSRLPHFQKLADTIRNHWHGIINYMITRISNGVMEAINGVLQLAKRIARGYRSLENFRAIAYLKAANLAPLIPKIPKIAPT